MHGDAEAAQLHRGGIFLASQEGALRLQVTMNNVVLVAVTQRFEDLSHVVTVKESAVFLAYQAAVCAPMSPEVEEHVLVPGTIAKGRYTRRGYFATQKSEALSGNLNRTIKACLVTSRNDFTPYKILKYSSDVVVSSESRKI